MYVYKEENSLIEVKHLSKKYGDHLAVDDLSFTVETGQIYGFLGPNGAGKSTTMNMITGCLAATSGQVLVGGYDIFAQPKEAKRLIGYLPELPPLYPDMTPAEYLRFVAEAKGVDPAKIDEQVSHVLELTRVTELKDRLIRNLSKGYRQRVGLAQAILSDPQVVILDEPTVGLDPKQIIEMRELILELGKNRTVILSSHIMQEISAVCDHLIIISQGKLVASGTPDELSGKLAGSKQLTVTVLGEEAAVRQALASLEGIQSMQIAPSLTSEGAQELVIETAGDTDIRQALSLALSAAGLAIIGMNAKTVTLEDIFLELTYNQDEAQVMAEAEAANAKIDGEAQVEAAAPAGAEPEEPDGKEEEDA